MNETVAAMYRERAVAQQATVAAYPVGTRFADKAGATTEVARIDGLIFYFESARWQEAVADEEGIVRPTRAKLLAVSAYEVAQMIENGTMEVQR